MNTHDNDSPAGEQGIATSEPQLERPRKGGLHRAGASTSGQPQPQASRPHQQPDRCCGTSVSTSRPSPQHVHSVLTRTSDNCTVLCIIIHA